MDLIGIIGTTKVVPFYKALILPCRSIFPE